jgi:D-glycero-D-manno-heptose 1,7-bisphosphate phosphatase
MVGAIFFDRDGVINELVWHDNELGSPRYISEIKIRPGIIDALTILRSKYLIFMISNQPDACKGNISYNNLLIILNWFKMEFKDYFNEFYFCLHHPSRCNCLCRKPGNYFIQQATQKYNINIYESYIVGDSNTDIECGKISNLKPIFIDHASNVYKILVTNIPI